MDLLPGKVSRSATILPPSASSTATPVRRKSSLSAARRVINVIETGDGPSGAMRRSSIAWETMSQTLALQVQQYRRLSELAASRRQPKSIPEEHQDHTTMGMHEEEDSDKVVSTTTKDKLPDHRRSSAGSISEFQESLMEDTSLLRTDVHIVPMAKLVERFHSDLQNGLSNDTVTQHRAEYGQNKLTPPPNPSILWMFIKQMLIGFNGILWIATLFAFLSYVSLC
jgi:magnesium-transporting ATPase (P-type)